MKKTIAFLLSLLVIAVSLTACGNSNSSYSGKDISLNDMKNADTSYLQVNGKTFAYPFTLNDFFNAFPEYDGYVTFDGVDALFGAFGEMDLKQELEYGKYIEVKVVKKDGEEDAKTKINNTRFRLQALVTSKDDLSLGNGAVFGVNYQYTKAYDFGDIKINGIKVNETTVGEVKKFFEETFGEYTASSSMIHVYKDVTSKKAKSLEYLGKERYPEYNVSVGITNELEDTAIITYVNVVYAESR